MKFLCRWRVPFPVFCASRTVDWAWQKTAVALLGTTDSKRRSELSKLLHKNYRSCSLCWYFVSPRLLTYLQFRSVVFCVMHLRRNWGPTYSTLKGTLHAEALSSIPEHYTECLSTAHAGVIFPVCRSFLRACQSSWRWSVLPCRRAVLTWILGFIYRWVHYFMEWM